MPTLIPCLLLAAAAPAFADEPVGTFGASIDLPEDWKRDVISPALGADQFHDASGLYMAVTELRGTFLGPDDLRSRMKQHTVGFETQSGKAVGPVTVEERGGVLHAEQEWHLKARGIELAYDVHIFARGGLGYLVLTWSAKKQALELRRAGKQLVRRFEMPGADSEWARLATPVVEENEIAGYEVRFAYPPTHFSLLDEKSRSDAFAALTAADQRLSVYFLLERSEDGVEAMLDGAVQAASGVVTTVDHTERFDVTIDGRPGRVALLEGSAAASAMSAAIAVVPVEDGVYLDVRFVAYGAFDSRRALWDALVGSIDIAERPKLDAFPVVESKPVAIPLTPHQKALLEASTSIGEASYGTAYRRAGTDLYVESYRGVEVMSLADGQTRALALAGEAKPLLPATRPDGLYVPVKDGDVVRQADGKTEPAGFSAALLADAGARGLLIVRAPTAPKVAGFARLAAPTGQQVLLRADSGDERVLLDLRHEKVTALTVDGDEALLAVSDPDRPYGNARLVVLGLADGAVRPLGAWQSVGAVAPGRDGWFVTGAPKDETAGVYQLSRQGERTLLLSGRHAAVLPLDDGELLLLTRWHPPSVAAEASTVLALRVPAPVVAEHGPRFDPFTASHVQQVAHAAMGTLGLSPNPTSVMTDPKAIRRFVDAASRASEARVGVALPRDAEGIDRLLVEASGEAALGQEGYLLLTALLSDHLLTQGATWASGRPPTGVSFGMALEPANDHAQGHLPLDIVRSTIQDSEGWWNPATSIRDQLDGRALVIGVDPDAIQARVDALDRAGDEALVEGGKVADLVAWLAVEPANVHLRNAIYTRLAAIGRAPDLVPVTEAFLAKGARSYADLRANLAGRVAQGIDAARYPGLVADLRAAIGEHPDETALYVLLALVYEQGGGADGKLLAAACYRHVDDEMEWSPFRNEVKAALVRLDP